MIKIICCFFSHYRSVYKYFIFEFYSQNSLNRNLRLIASFLLKNIRHFTPTHSTRPRTNKTGEA